MAKGAGHGAVGLARFGYVVRGVVYGLIGALTGETALGMSNGQITDSTGAIVTIYQQPFGEYLLAAVTIGLFSYAIWNLVSALLDLEQHGFDPRGVGTRLSFIVGGVSYTFLGLAALGLLRGTSAQARGSDILARDWTAAFLDMPYGVGLVVAAGMVMLVAAALQLLIAITADFARQLNLDRAFRVTRVVVYTLGRLGYGSLGVVLGTVGVFLVVAALDHNPDDAKGLGGALAELATQPFGQIVLGIVAVGLVAYGLYSIAESRYRRIV